MDAIMDAVLSTSLMCWQLSCRMERKNKQNLAAGRAKVARQQQQKQQQEKASSSAGGSSSVVGTVLPMINRGMQWYRAEPCHGCVST